MVLRVPRGLRSDDEPAAPQGAASASPPRDALYEGEVGGGVEGICEGGRVGRLSVQLPDTSLVGVQNVPHVCGRAAVVVAVL